jgi:proteasome lid subunit RPN8/RPN11
MEELRIPKHHVEEMIGHCRLGRPNEACGILGSRDGMVVRVFRMSNASASPVRYSLDPKEQLAVYNELDGEGLELAAVFHSHTRTPPHPSPTDIRLAAEDVPYVIVSLAVEPPAVKAWRIIKQSWSQQYGDVREVLLVIVD